LRDALASNPQVVMIDGANPVFTAPRAWQVRAALEKVPFIISFGSFLDETSALADLILPDHSFLESWTASMPESGAHVAVASAAPPAMRPLHNTRATGDVLLEAGRRLASPVALPWQTYEEMLSASFGEQWAGVQEKGWVELSGAAAVQGTPASPATGAAASEPAFDGDPGEYPFHFLPYPSTQFGDGSTAHLPWLQEMPDPITSAMWSTWVEINPRTAERLGIAEGDLVEVTSTQGALRAPAFISPAIAPDVVAMPAGQGHQTFTRYASGRGANPLALVAPVTEAATGAVAWAATRVRIARAGDPDGSLILFAGAMREHGEHGR
jgi:anaerobic selenocysteine-containing dehydrogenase